MGFARPGLFVKSQTGEARKFFGLEAETRELGKIPDAISSSNFDNSLGRDGTDAGDF